MAAPVFRFDSVEVCCSRGEYTLVFRQGGSPDKGVYSIVVATAICTKEGLDALVIALRLVA